MASSMALAVLGVRVHGDSVTDVDVHLDDSFKGVPVPNKIGIPLAYKLMSGTGGDDSHIKRMRSFDSWQIQMTDGLLILGSMAEGKARLLL